MNDSKSKKSTKQKKSPKSTSPKPKKQDKTPAIIWPTWEKQEPEKKEFPPPDIDKDSASINQVEDLKESAVSAADSAWVLEVSWDVEKNFEKLYTTNSNRLILVGRDWLCDRFTNEFKDEDFPADSPPDQAVQWLRRMGLDVRAGTWDRLPGKPLGILLDVESAPEWIRDRYRSELIRDDGIEIPLDDQEAMDALVFGYMAAELLTQFHYARSPSPVQSMANFNDWICGIGLLFLTDWFTPMPTVFKIESTVLGDSVRRGKDPAEEASKRGILYRFQIEQKAAYRAGLFRTSSVIVARQAAQHLKKRPDFSLGSRPPQIAEPPDAPDSEDPASSPDQE